MQIEGSVRDTLGARGIAHRDVDHGDHRSVYFHDPDGHMLEIYHAPSETAEVTLPVAERFARAKEFVFGNARLVDRVAYEVAFERCDGTRLTRALDAYRNADGAFGHALEPDLRTPRSQPLHVETGLAILKEAQVKARGIAQDCCEFLAGVAASDAALPAFLPGALDYPAAAHWRAGFGATPSLERTCGAVALLMWHGAKHPWLEHAAERCRRYVASATIGEAHLLLYAAQFACTALRGEERSAVLDRLRALLPSAEFYVAGTPVATYGLTPLHFAPRPDAATRVFFDAPTIVRHLDDLEASQRADGGWTIRFAPPTPAAVLEWRGRWTLEALHTLRAYGRLG